MDDQPHVSVSPPPDPEPEPVEDQTAGAVLILSLVHGLAAAKSRRR